MTRPCTCDNVRIGPYTIDQCRPCWHAHNTPKFQRKWGLPVTRTGQCIHLGGETGEAVECRSCKGRTRIKLRQCEVHGQCTTHKKLDGIDCCIGCPDFQAAGEQIAVRNLLFHVMPRHGNGIWQRCVGQLLRRMHLFNGHRVVAVVTGPGLDPPEHVADQFAGKAHEFIELSNDRGLREVQTFHPLMERVENTNPQHATFYCHAKGVTHQPEHTSHAWADVLFQANLDFWPIVAQQLSERAMTGAMKCHRHQWPRQSAARWFYSGSFYWMRNKDVFARDWRKIDRIWTGVEPWPGIQFRKEETACIFEENAWMSPYDWRYVHGLLDRFDTWKRANAHRCTKTA